MKGLGNWQKIIKSATEMQEKLEKEMAELRLEGSSGGGMVTVTLDGRKNLLSIRLDPEVINRDDLEMLQDLIVAAFADAAGKVDRHLSERLGGALKIPGLG